MQNKTLQFSKVFLVALVIAFSFFITACKKEKCNRDMSTTDPALKEKVAAQTPAVQNGSITQILTVAMITPSDISGMNNVMFLENAEIFHVAKGSDVANGLSLALSKNTKLAVTFNPWLQTVTAIATPSPADLSKANGHSTSLKTGTALNVDLLNMSDISIDNRERLGIINTTPASGMTAVIPDLATAQSMFNYITTQCCALGGPYSIDYCISFQYCQDGCYARAHKMCDILNHKYHYDTHKIFSFANSGGDQLSVKADKWGGCCVNWWYHVAPLVSVNTPTGVKPYVFDPAMFDQPVLLSTWLHAQENPACSGSAHVSMINVQPTSSFWPSSGSGLTFADDPTYYYTNSTLVSYSGLITCP